VLRVAPHFDRRRFESELAGLQTAVVADDHVKQHKTVSFARDSIRVTDEVFAATLAAEKQIPHRSLVAARSMPPRVTLNSEIWVHFRP
jgi:hypothetical protein